MDRNEEDMKFVGFFGIFKQSFKTIFSCKKIFSQITLAFLLPLAVVFFGRISLARHFFPQIETSPWSVDPENSHNFNRTTSLDWLYYLLFELAYFTTLTLFSLLATTTVVFTVASLYTARDPLSFRKLLAIVPNVAKRLVLTLLVVFLAFFIYNILTGLAFFLSRFIFGYSIFGVVFLLVILILYVYGFLYLSAVSQLASVTTVLENVQGFTAMRKARDLVKGKKAMSMGVVFVLYGILCGIMVVYVWFVLYGDEIFERKVVLRVLIGIGDGFLLMVLLVLFFVSQTMIYLVCKSYHGGVIDRLCLSTCLGSYSVETVVLPKVGEEIQLGRTQPQARNSSEQV